MRREGNLLFKGVGPCSPPGEEDREANSLENLGENAHTHGLEGALLDEDLVEELGRAISVGTLIGMWE